MLLLRVESDVLVDSDCRLDEVPSGKANATHRSMKRLLEIRTGISKC